MSLIQEFERPVRIELVEKVHEYDDVYTYTFRPEQPLHYLSGQSAHVIVPGLSGKEARRSFSFASAPHEELLWFATHIHTESEYKRAWKKIETGESFTITKIKSPTVLPDDPSVPVVMIGGGIGLAPYRSMLVDMQHRTLVTKATLIHVSNSDFLYEEELSKLPYEQHRIERKDIERTYAEVIEKNQDAVYYIAGPSLFIIELKRFAEERGISSDRILTSLFKRYMGFLE